MTSIVDALNSMLGAKMLAVAEPVIISLLIAAGAWLFQQTFSGLVWWWTSWGEKMSLASALLADIQTNVDNCRDDFKDSDKMEAIARARTNRKMKPPQPMLLVKTADNFIFEAVKKRRPSTAFHCGRFGRRVLYKVTTV